MSSAKSPPLHQPGDLVNGRYRIERPLGRGAMGEVYLAVDQARGDARVAMKYLLAANQQSAINRFKAEFATLIHLSHPHITPVYDLARDEVCGVHFFTTEYVQGTTVDVVAQEVPLATVLGVWVQVLRALHYLHGHGRLHLDIKAHNVMVQTVAGAQPCAKLIDFGLAATGWCGTRLGTPSYMAPEVVQHQEPNARADLYSMGVLLYLLLTRTNPFRASTAAATMARQVTVVPPPPSVVNPALAGHGYLDTIVEHLLAKDPADRYDSAEAVLRELGRIGPVAVAIETEETLGAYVPSASVFVGRAAERAVLHAQVTRYEDARPVAWITGARGVGKTRLLQEAKALAQVADYETVWVSPDAPDGYAAAVARVQAVAGGSEASVSSADAAPHLWIGIDDVHVLLQDDRAAALWPALRSLCAHLALQQQLGERPSLTLVLSSVADAETLTRVRTTLGLTEPSTTVLPLAHFSDADLQAYLAVLTGLPDPPLSLRAQIAEYTGGHPLFVAETVKALIHRGLLFDPAGRWRSTTFEDLGVNLRQLQIPGTIESLVARDYVALGPAEQQLVGVLAVADRPMTAMMLQQVLGDAAPAEARITELLHAPVMAPLLAYDPLNATYHFQTRAQQQAIYQQIGHAQCEQWHDALAAVLAADPAAELADLCRHRSHGSDPARAQTARRALAEHWMECGRAADAIPLLDTYLRAAPPDDPHRWALYALWGTAHHRTRQFARAIEIFREAIAALGAVPHAAPADARTWHRRYREAWGHAAMRQGHYAEAEHQYGQVLEMMGDEADDDAERIRIENAVLQTQLYQADQPEALAHAVAGFRRTAEAARHLPLALRHTITNNDLGHALFQQRNMDAAIHVLTQDAAWYALAQQQSAHIRSLGLLAEVYRVLRKYNDAITTCTQAIALAKQHHDVEQLMQLYQYLGNMYEGQSHMSPDAQKKLQTLQRALTYYERSLDLSVRFGEVSRAIVCTLNMGILRRSSGDLIGAMRLWQSTIAFAEQHHTVAGLDAQHWCQAHLELGNLCAQQQDFARAHQHTEHARRLAEQLPSARHLWFWAVATEVEICRDEQHHEAAVTLVPEMNRLATSAETKAVAQQIMTSLGLRG